jgi:hypothetical protein
LFNLFFSFTVNPTTAKNKTKLESCSYIINSLDRNSYWCSFN